MFKPGKSYRRDQLHHAWDGDIPAQSRVGILTPKQAPVVILVTGAAGKKHGYADWVDDTGIWRYFGEGSRGDMKWVKGNKAIRDHAVDGKELHLFHAEKPGVLEYIGQFVCAEYDVLPDEPDTDGRPRKAFVFLLVPFEDSDQSGSFDPDLGSGRSRWDVPMEELRAAAAQPATRQEAAPGARRKSYHRSEALKVYVLRRADGACEGCRAAAPFQTKHGRGYLEPHHTTRLADGGPDHPAHVIALCPNCHRRVHHGADGDEYNSELKRLLKSLERSQPRTEVAPQTS